MHELGPFDFAMSFSRWAFSAVCVSLNTQDCSLEHSGLGRYGDPFNVFGDMFEMAKLSCLVKPGHTISAHMAL